MSFYQSVFCRKELKYTLHGAQHEKLLAQLEPHLVPDGFFASSISNLYYDTSDFLLIRRSLEKPKYKEKLRLRCYGTPDEKSESFVEIKKKFNGVVYKRRESLPYQKALYYLLGAEPGGDSQIFRELDWLLQFYGDLRPAMFLSYNRHSYKGAEDGAIRITFDRDILWRTTALDLRGGAWGTPLLPADCRLMEIKISGAMPLWLSEALAALQIYPNSVSKYGLAYQTWVQQGMCDREEPKYA